MYLYDDSIWCDMIFDMRRHKMSYDNISKTRAAIGWKPYFLNSPDTLKISCYKHHSHPSLFLYTE